MERIRSEIQDAGPRRHLRREKSVIGPVPMQTVKKNFATPGLTKNHDEPYVVGNFYDMVDRVRSEMVHLEKEQLEDFLRWRAAVRKRNANSHCDSIPDDATPNNTVSQDVPPIDTKPVVANLEASQECGIKQDTEAAARTPVDTATCQQPLHRRGEPWKRIRFAVAGIVLALICCVVFPLIGHMLPGRDVSHDVREPVTPTGTEPSTQSEIREIPPRFASAERLRTDTDTPNANSPQTTPGFGAFGVIAFNEPDSHSAAIQSAVSQTAIPDNNIFSTDVAVSNVPGNAMPARAEDLFPTNSGLQQVAQLDPAQQAEADRQLLETQTQLNELMQQNEKARQANEQLERIAKQNEAESLLWEAYANAGKDPIRSMVLSLQAIERFEELGLEIPNNAKWVLSQSLVSQNLGISLNGFQGGVDAMTSSKDGQWFLFADDSGAVWLWDIAKHAQPGGSFKLDTINGGVSQLIMTSKTDWGICIARNGSIRIWNLKLEKPAEKPIDIIDPRCRFSRAVLSHDGRWLAAYGRPEKGRESGQGHEIYLWDLSQLANSGKIAAPILLKGHEKPIRSLAISRNSKWLVSGSEDRTVRVYDLKAAYPAAEQIVLKGHELAVYCVAVSPDGKWLASGGRDSILRIWNLQSRQNMSMPLQMQEHEGWISALAFSPDGRYLASGSYDNTIRLWQMQDDGRPEVAHVLNGHVGPIKSLEFSSQGNRIVSLGLDREVRLWDIEQGNPSENVLAFRSSHVPFSSVLLSGNDEWLILAQPRPNSPGQSGLRLWPMRFRETFKSATGFAAANFPNLYQHRQNPVESNVVQQEERIAQNGSLTQPGTQFPVMPLPETATAPENVLPNVGANVPQNLMSPATPQETQQSVTSGEAAGSSPIDIHFNIQNSVPAQVLNNQSAFR